MNPICHNDLGITNLQKKPYRSHNKKENQGLTL